MARQRWDAGGVRVLASVWYIIGQDMLTTFPKGAFPRHDRGILQHALAHSPPARRANDSGMKAVPRLQAVLDFYGADGVAGRGGVPRRRVA